MSNKKNNSVRISFDVTPEVAKALDQAVWLDFDTRASYMRELLSSDLKNLHLLDIGTPVAPAEARARRAALARRATA